jgi:hypothetical protein
MSKNLDKLTWQKAIISLKDNGVARIVVSYSGSGDSGGIDEVSYFDKENTEIKHDELAVDHNGVQDLAYPLLEGIEDWYNNEGGDGTIDIHLNTLKYKIVNNVNIMEQETFNHKGSIKKIMKNAD